MSSATLSDETKPPYDLWYWPGIQGAANSSACSSPLWTFAGATVRAMPMRRRWSRIWKRAPKTASPLMPPPYLVERESDFAIAQVAHIVTWLNEKHGRSTGDAATDLHLVQLQLTITDIVAEVHDVHHPIAGSLYYDDQKDAAKIAAEKFRAERIPKYFDHFEQALGVMDGPFMAGESWSHVDTSLFQLIEGLRYAFPQRMKAIEADYPRLVACRDAVAKIEGVARYLDSERRIAFNEDGIFRHYPELDAS